MKLLRLVALLLLMCLALMAYGPAPSSAQESAEIPPPKAFVVIDADTGVVLLGHDEHVRRAPASISKLMTALVAQDKLQPDSSIKVSQAAADMPARKLNIKAGEVWNEHDLLQAMLLCSCNDIARALAENAGGSVGGFGQLARAEAQRIGVVDEPVLQDPAGLDDEFSVGGGNRISAFDLAIIARAFLAEPELAAAAMVQKFEFVGPDGAAHSVTNHNKLLGTYEGAIGLKTGYTKRAGATLVAAARRDGRTIVAVLLGSQSIWYHAPQLLDYGFRTAVAPGMESLPPLPGTAPESLAAVPPDVGTKAIDSLPAVGESVAQAAPIRAASGAAEPAAGGESGSVLPIVLAGVVLTLMLAVVLRRRLVVRSRSEARARARARQESLEAMLVD